MKLLLAWTFLLRLLLLRPVVVCTIHNERPHERGGPMTRLFLRSFERLTDGYIVMNPATAVPPGRPSVLIPHGHYRKWFPTGVRVAPVAGQVLLFGMLRPYKGIERLIDAFLDLPEDRDARLTIAGRSLDPRYCSDLVDRAAGAERVRFRFGHLDDEDLRQEILHAELIVLPYPRLLNSGAVLLALSLDRPVLLIEGQTSRGLRSEFGEDWVLLAPPDMQSQHIADALDLLQHRDWQTCRVEMAEREWPPIAAATEDFYRMLLEKSHREHTA